jgi:hypothetical protein
MYIVWFPEHVAANQVVQQIQEWVHERSPFEPFEQQIQDWIYGRFPAFNHTRYYLNKHFDVIDSTCAICFENNAHRQTQLKCNHIFHKHCIEQWRLAQRLKGQTPTCPVCRGAC